MSPERTASILGIPSIVLGWNTPFRTCICLIEMRDHKASPSLAGAINILCLPQSLNVMLPVTFSRGRRATKSWRDAAPAGLEPSSGQIARLARQGGSTAKAGERRTGSTPHPWTTPTNHGFGDVKTNCSRPGALFYQQEAQAGCRKHYAQKLVRMEPPLRSLRLRSGQGEATGSPRVVRGRRFGARHSPDGLTLQPCEDLRSFFPSVRTHKNLKDAQIGPDAKKH